MQHQENLLFADLRGPFWGQYGCCRTPRKRNGSVMNEFIAGPFCLSLRFGAAMASGGVQPDTVSPRQNRNSGASRAMRPVGVMAPPQWLGRRQQSRAVDPAGTSDGGHARSA
jgi:hypothetical protein